AVATAAVMEARDSFMDGSFNECGVGDRSGLHVPHRIDHAGCDDGALINDEGALGEDRFAEVLDGEGCAACELGAEAFGAGEFLDAGAALRISTTSGFCLHEDFNAF